MSSNISLSNIFVPSQCSIQYPYLSPNEDIWVDCQSRKAIVTTYYVWILIALILLGIYYTYTQNKKEDPTVAFPTKWVVGLIVVGVLFRWLYPMYGEKLAALEYEQFEQEFHEFKRANPHADMSEYLQLKFGERQAKAASSIASSQQVMAGAFALDTLGSIFGGGRRR
jgi:hypothetical protein